MQIRGIILDFNGVLIAAERYLIPGPDTNALIEADISFESWPTVSGSQGPLPDRWWIMPKGLLLAYFEWYKKKPEAREEALP